MRILTVGNMYPPHHLGGYELMWHSAVRHLREAGHQVRMLTTDYRNPSPDPDIAEDPEVRRDLRWYWHDHEFPRMGGLERARLERHNGRVLERELRDLQPDAVGWWAMGGMSLSLIESVRRAGLPSVGIVADMWMLYGPQVDGWTRLVRRLRRLGSPVSRMAGIPPGRDLSGVTWLFSSDLLRVRALEAGYRFESCEVAHPGVDERLFRPQPEHEWRWRLLYVGRIDERKGIDAAVAALSHLPAEAHLTVLGAGDDEYLTSLRALGSELGLEGRVEFGVRPRTRLPAAYAEADALLFPVRWEEPWGIVPLEAMAVGTPVVGTGRGGSGEYMEHGDNALVIGEHAGPEELARAVSELASDPALRGRLREGGLRTASRFTEAAYNARIAAAFERVRGG